MAPMGPGTYDSKKGRPKAKSFIKQVDAPKSIDMRKKTLMLLAKKKKKK
jgi:hypothetical protein